jgi:hypothetical protein
MGGPWKSKDRKDYSWAMPPEARLAQSVKDSESRREMSNFASIAMMLVIGFVIGAVMVLASAPLWVYWLPVK